MDNIYQTWTEFHKLQNHALKGKSSLPWLKSAVASSGNWGRKNYPIGEDWKYVDFKDLPRTRLHWPKADQETKEVADEHFICIEVKNFTSPAKIRQGAWPEGLTVTSHLDSLETLKDQVISDPVNQNPFQEIAESFVGQGMVVRFSSKYKETKPLKIVFDLDHFSQKDLYVHYNIDVIAESGAQARLFIDTQAQTFSGLANICTRVHTKSDAKLSLYNKEWGGPQSFLINNVQAEVAAEAEFSHFDFTFPSHWSRHNINVNLLDKKARTDLIGAYFNDAKNFCDHHTFIKHSKGHTESIEDYRGLLSDEARAVFNGKIYIEKQASKSNSDQINKNLMLSKKAEVDTKPELQIYNDDVKAAHGATVGQLDEEQRFYLLSRGYSRDQASRILSKAFVYDLLKNQAQEVVDFYSDDIDKSLLQLKEG